MKAIKLVAVFNTHQPAFRMEQYFEEVCTVLDQLTHHGTRALTMNLATKLYMSVLMNRCRHEIIAKSTPDIAIKLLGGISKLLGIRY